MYDGGVIILLMGVEGSGKTTVGVALAKRLSWEFRDADEFHSAGNKLKMTAGIPLNDDDRAPWLSAIRAAMDKANAEQRNLVITCSALKEKYRQVLAAEHTHFVWLKGSQELIAARLARRENHFAKGNLLSSQFEALEEPQGALEIDIGQPVDGIVGDIVQKLGIGSAHPLTS